MKIALTQELVSKYFNYNIEDGHLYWKWHHQPKILKRVEGKRFGSISKDGYVEGHVAGNHTTEHRLVFLLHHGYLPDEVDHWDRDESNNRIENLREATRTDNNLNHNLRVDNKTGVKGAYWSKSSNKWVGRIKISGKTIYLGVFNSLDEVAKAREEAERMYA